MHVTIADLESYLTHQYHGWANEQGLFMKLVEEIGEVAEILNKKSGRKATGEEDINGQLGLELADVIHYVIAIAAVNGLNLENIILAKDKAASLKYHHDMNLEQFIQNKP